MPLSSLTLIGRNERNSGAMNSAALFDWLCHVPLASREISLAMLTEGSVDEGIKLASF